MTDLDLVGIDLAKNVFQLHGCNLKGEVVFRKQVRRSGLLLFISNLPTCIIAMEACSGSHYWGREFEALGHSVRLIPPKYVKPFVKRSKSDAIDAEAICEAALRPTMSHTAGDAWHRREGDLCGSGVKTIRRPPSHFGPEMSWLQRFAFYLNHANAYRAEIFDFRQRKAFQV